MASSLTPVSVSVLLEYISPPSQLSQTLPPHLLSQSLLQRHHFLDIHPADDPISYLSWPSSDQHQAFNLLESYSRDHKGYAPQFHVRYTADHGSLVAHAELPLSAGSPGLRLVFHWDGLDGTWKYHNIALMPFPLNSYDSIAKAEQILAQGVDFLEEEPAKTNPTDEDAYWDAYGQEGDYKLDAEMSSSQTDTQAEDAYWAQYASIQGTADSTIPSPIIDTKRKPLPADDPYESQWNESASHDDHAEWKNSAHPEDSTEHILDIPYTSLNINPSAPPQYNPHSPPPPKELSDRLSALSQQEDDEKDRHVNGIQKSPDSEAAVREAIRGTYRLWKLSAPPGTFDGNEAEGQFLRLVREAIEQ